MDNLKELERQYFEARNAMDWQTMANIMRLVYPEHETPQKPKREANIKPLQAGCRLNE